MSAPVLTLAVAPMAAGESFVTRPARIGWAVSANASAAPAAFAPDDPAWTVHLSAFDYRPAIHLINGLAEASALGGPLAALLRHESVSYWQFLGFYLWGECFRVTELLDVVMGLLEQTRPGAVRILPVADGSNVLWMGVVTAACAYHAILVINPPADRRPRPLGPVFRAWDRWLLRRSQRRPLPPRVENSQPRPHGERKVLLVTMGRRHWATVPGDPGRRYDEQYYPLLADLEAHGWKEFTLVDCQDLPAEELRAREQEQGPALRWRTLRSFETGAGRRARARAGRAFRRLWRLLRDDPQFDAALRWRGVRLMPALAEKLRRDFHHELPRCAQTLTTAGAALAQERPDIVIASHEAYPWARSLLIQAGRAGIPTLGLQHGMIFDNHPDYMRRPLTTDAAECAHGFLIPQTTCVWGPFWRRVLTDDGAYPPASVTVTGNWRYDHLLDVTAATDRDVLRQEFGLNPADGVVLILSAELNVPNFIRLCLRTLAVTPGATPLIKLHPNDDPEPVRRVLREEGCPEHRLVQGRLTEALMACDLVVSQPSTVLAEAALLGRPIVGVNLERIAGFDTFWESGICLVVTESESLPGAVAMALGDTETQKRLCEARSRFVSEFFGPRTGRAASRVADAAEELLRWGGGERCV